MKNVTRMLTIFACHMVTVLALILPGQASAEDPLKIGITIWPGWMPWWIVEEKDYFEEVGANAEIVHFKRHPDAMGAFNAHKLDASHMILADVIIPASKGVPARVVIITDESSGADGIVAKPEIDTLEGFEGKRVAYEFGGVSQLLLTKALGRVGLTLDDVRSINMAAEDAGTAFLSGSVDAAVTWEPYLSQAENRGKGHVIFSTADTPGLVPDLVAFRAEAIRDRPDDVQKVVEAWSLALDFIDTNRSEAMKIMAEGAGVTSDEMEEQWAGIKLYSIADNVEAFTSGRFVEVAQTQAEFLKASGVIDEIPEVKKLIAPQFMKRVHSE